MRTAAPPPIPAELPADGIVVPVWAYRSEAFAEDIVEQTLPGLPSPRPRELRGSGPLWPWALGVPMLVLAIGLVAAFHA